MNIKKPHRGSAPAPDHILLSICGDAKTSMAVSWRTDCTVTQGWAEVRRDYGAASTLYGRLKSAQWTIAAAIVFLSYYPTKWLSWVFAPTLLVWAVLVFYLGEYFIVQKMIPHHVRQFMAWKNGERMYILLCSDKLYYCVRAERKEDRLDIFPDDVLLLEREEADRSFHRIRFTDFKVIQR